MRFQIPSSTRLDSVSARRRPRAGLLPPLLCVLGLLGPTAVQAATITWFGPSGSWSTVNSWWPRQLPAAGDVVWVKAPDGVSLSVAYSSPTGPLLGTLHVDSADAAGAATLSQSQDLLQANVHNVGVTGRGVHSLSGGTSSVNKLHLAYWGSAHGTYDLSGSGSLVANLESVGNLGIGVFNHSGGSNVVSGNLGVGYFAGSDGTYELSGSATLSSGHLLVGNAGHGSFYQVGATNSVDGSLTIAGFASAIGRYELSGDGSLVSHHQYVGGAGTGTLVQTSGSNYASGNLVLASLAGGDGRYELSGTGTLSANDQFVGSARLGHFVQSGGVNTVRRNLTLGNLGGGDGTYELSGDGALTAVREYLGGFGTGVVQQTGGTNTISTLLQAGVWGGAYGRYELSGTGVLEVPDVILGGFGAGHFVQTGGEAIIDNVLELCQWPNSVGTYTLQGGLLSLEAIDNKPGGQFYFSGGELDALTFANAAELHLSGEGVRVVTPQVTNNGAVYVTETQASFSETFINNSAYVSEDSDNEFSGLIVGSGGYLSASDDSRFSVIGNLSSASIQFALWQTSLAELVFVASDDDAHTLSQPGQDLGASYDGYVENFAWGKLSLEEGQSLSLGNGTGALYVTVLDLADGIDQLASIASDGTNIYYDASDPENGYLG